MGDLFPIVFGFGLALVLTRGWWDKQLSTMPIVTEENFKI